MYVKNQMVLFMRLLACNNAYMTQMLLLIGVLRASGILSYSLPDQDCAHVNYLCLVSKHHMF